MTGKSNDADWLSKWQQGMDVKGARKTGGHAIQVKGQWCPGEDSNLHVLSDTGT